MFAEWTWHSEKTLKKDNQRLTTVISSSKNLLDSQQKQIAALEKENQRLTTVISSSKTRLDSQQKQIAALEKENQRFHIIRYIDNGDGTVTDIWRELIWLKNANCFGKQNRKKAKKSAARLRSGQCGLRDGSKAGMWRLPTEEEWKAMVDKRYKNPALSNAAGTAKWAEGDAFSGVQTGDYYWSFNRSISIILFYSKFKNVSLYSGNVFTNENILTNYVWPVRRRQ